MFKGMAMTGVGTLGVGRSSGRLSGDDEQRMATASKALRYQEDV
jgi:hypothetical protein